jgi:hypothetical protein
MSLPDMSTRDIYQEVMNHYNQDVLDNEFIEYATSFSSLFVMERSNGRISKDLADLSDTECTLFLFTLAEFKEKYNEYSDLPLELMEKQRTKILNDLPSYIEFSDDGDPVIFSSGDELQAFILHNVVLTNEKAAGPFKVEFAAEEKF